jgi:hypothetical protein
MSKTVISIENANTPLTVPATGISQIGEKNTQVAHAENLIINNYIIADKSVMLANVTPNFAAYSMAQQINTNYYNLFVTFSEIKNNRIEELNDVGLLPNGVNE